MVTQQELKSKFHYDPETGLFHRITKKRDDKRYFQVAGTRKETGHITISINDKRYYAHRLAWLYMTGEWPSDFIDHKDRDPGNNKFENLRIATNQKNLQNRINPSCNNKLGILGVSQRGEKFAAFIKINGKNKYLGVHDTPEKAHMAYLKAKKEIHPFCYDD